MHLVSNKPKAQNVQIFNAILCCLVFSVNRQTSGDVEVGGMKIKKGMAIVIPVRAIHMDPQTWPEPEKFDPER